MRTKIVLKKIVVIDATFEVSKRKSEKIQACTRFQPLDLCDTDAALYHLS